MIFRERDYKDIKSLCSNSIGHIFKSNSIANFNMYISITCCFKLYMFQNLIKTIFINFYKCKSIGFFQNLFGGILVKNEEYFSSQLMFSSPP